MPDMERDMEENKDGVEKNVLSKSENFEPGAARYGNFINYYSFNSVSKRLGVIPSDLLLQLNLIHQPALCLDIGCNSGELTLGLYSHLTSAYQEKPDLRILGIDLDDVLIERCKESNEFANHITYKTVNVMDESCLMLLIAHLQQFNRSEFDLITCFSTTMWIHLNHGDDGFSQFLKTISGITKYLLLEPQEWKCYKAAVRRMTRLNKEVFAIKKLKIKDVVQHISTFLRTDCNMDFVSCFGETSWGRKMYLYKKVNL
ncbi:pre-miRNA 5'-monophosphate methyltransferase-like [Uloborus diversus]|uniref:pre-miRNA 5'-monophosphate methyltransferase-like n=1 Tax=Uloborus diversus TaxID=327109 RepID=UPI00240A7965|nr:pre-miRNA 5'-monophosphate methyltransferase-like [Uloborus diversus]